VIQRPRGTGSPSSGTHADGARDVDDFGAELARVAMELGLWVDGRNTSPDGHRGS
jgi:hypothetical protein